MLLFLQKMHGKAAEIGVDVNGFVVAFGIDFFGFFDKFQALVLSVGFCTLDKVGFNGNVTELAIALGFHDFNIAADKNRAVAVF